MLGNHLVNVSSAAEHKHCVLYTRSWLVQYIGRQVQKQISVWTDELMNLTVDFEIKALVFW